MVSECTKRNTTVHRGPLTFYFNYDGSLKYVSRKSFERLEKFKKKYHRTVGIYRTAKKKNINTLRTITYTVAERRVSAAKLHASA